MFKRLITTFTVLLMVGVAAAPASADPHGFIEDRFEYGFFYGTFDQSPNVALFAGGRIEEFCLATQEPPRSACFYGTTGRWT